MHTQGSATGTAAVPLVDRYSPTVQSPLSTRTVSLGAMLTARVGDPAAVGPAVSKAASVPTTSGTHIAPAGVSGVDGPLAGGVVNTTAVQVVKYALAQQGKPYVFGTSGPDTFDCSGLISAAYRSAGIEFAAYTGTQATLGRPVDPTVEALRPGDLIFVRGGRPAQDLGHAGVAISATEWIRAPATGDVVKVGPLPDNIQVVRRLVDP